MKNGINTKASILIVDDDIRILKLLKQFFEQNDFEVAVACSVEEAEELFSYFQFDLMILDVMLPKITGFEFAQKLRAAGTQLPIIMLTALNSSEDRITGLETGANDYLTKPFEPKELLLRVQNLVSLYKSGAYEINFGNYLYNFNSGNLTRNGEEVFLSNDEKNLLEALIQNSGKIMSRESLAQSSTAKKERSIDVSISRLRSKIESDPKRPKYLKTVRNKGYLLVI